MRFPQFQNDNVYVDGKLSQKFFRIKVSFGVFNGNDTMN